MTFTEFQTASARTKPRELPFREELLMFGLGLAGESGEVCELLKRWVRQGPDATLDVPELTNELGDVLWYLSQLALSCGITLDDIAAHNVEKLRARYPSGFTPDGGRR